ncbi:MAG: hypothetical protein HYU80_03825 [Candidatus Blackburnbacteria bacterium]|nr:hypothetical protein [Candidatus Blackburnbacteria bacterium]
MNIERLLKHGLDNLHSEYQSFKEREGFSHVLGVIGGSSTEQVPKYSNFLIEGCRLTKIRLGKFAIISGGTQGGVPELALDVAKTLRLPTIGVFPQASAKYAALKKIDFPISVPPQPLAQVTWGIETPTLVSIADAFVLIGGEWGTNAEVSMIMKRNSSLARHGTRLVPIIAINGSGKLADILEQLTRVFPTSEGTFLKVGTSTELASMLVQVFGGVVFSLFLQF